MRARVFTANSRGIQLRSEGDGAPNAVPDLRVAAGRFAGRFLIDNS